MTKSREGGNNEITDEANCESLRTKRSVCSILAEMLAKAKEANDTSLIAKIIKAQKYKGCRNIRKRGKK